MTDRNPHYRIVEGADAWALETAVKALLDEGWTAQGGVCVVPTGVSDSGPKFFQAMTRNAAPVPPPLAAAADVLPFPDPVGGPGGI
ncbi:DUF1737 domain-containing protein [Limnoglobus roseus]|uniref:DUF1737 domain-containing protein n=1 Tax=Limnoglobus roseus TaxID=2598579 RepID=A0A5C1ACK3_9BACT|nr:DUF1737 domain-containing protein [Limnoglobus roseus]QEL15867.1 hypothetical protein PX52LOC_02803 [Limnoglobus roseus]